ncbi:VAMP2 [Hibiscus syriacus]|uniref:VAMP2 n=1 Tax=Hibiscus syriacus TaxID=106335 RepID=A0A6A3BH39_HIBSY|nr:VAMP2 [Hibiscus syriacus]
MVQKSLIYALVSRGEVILAEYTEFSGNFNSIAFQCLQKLPSSNKKFTYNSFCDESAGRHVPIVFIERVKDDFVSKYGSGKAATAPANSLNKEFGPKLKEHMQYCVEHPEEISKLSKVKAQVSEVIGVMMENIEKGIISLGPRGRRRLQEHSSRPTSTPPLPDAMPPRCYPRRRLQKTQMTTHVTALGGCFCKIRPPETVAGGGANSGVWLPVGDRIPSGEGT